MHISNYIVFCLFVLLLNICGSFCKSNHSKQNRQRRLITLHRRNRMRNARDQLNKESIQSNRSHFFSRTSSFDGRQSRRTGARILRNKNSWKIRKNLKNRNKRKKHGSKKSHNIRQDIIKKADLSLPGLHHILEPKYWQERMNELQKPTETAHLRDVVRISRLYCRVGISYHLEINENGTVQANHRTTPEGILEIFSVKRSVVGIRSARSSLYLCMNKAGKVFTRKTFQPDCEFRENFENNNFNTYASEQYSDHKNRVGYFLTINKHGVIPKRTRKTSYLQRRTHWLPREV